MKEKIMSIFNELQQLELQSDSDRLCDALFQAQSALLEALDLVERKDDEWC